MTPKDLDDLIISISLGNENAFEELYINTKVAVFGLVFSILKNYTLAEDITHDVYIKIKFYSNRYKACEKGMSWILKIARNLSYNYLKKKKNTVPFDDELFLVNTPIENLDAEIILEKAMSKLNTNQREIVILYAVSGFSQKEIANLLNISYPTVRWHYHKAIKKLKNILEGEL